MVHGQKNIKFVEC